MSLVTERRIRFDFDSTYPKFRWILGGAALFERHVHFLVQALVPFAIHMPMLHGMRHVRGLNQMLQDNGGLAIDAIATIRLVVVLVFGLRRLVKGLFPTRIAQSLEMLVGNIRRHDPVLWQEMKKKEFTLVRKQNVGTRPFSKHLCMYECIYVRIDQELTKAFQFGLRRAQDATQGVKAGIQQQAPTQIERVLFRHGASAIHGGQGRVFNTQLIVGYPHVINVVNLVGEAKEGQ